MIAKYPTEIESKWNRRKVRAAIYTRSATGNVSSLGNQMEVCLQFATERGWNVVGVYQDTSASGATLERTQLQKMIKDARAKQFDIVAVYSADRLARSLLDLLLVEKQFRAIGVELVSVIDKTTLRILADKMIAGIRSLFSDYLERPVNSKDTY